MAASRSSDGAGGSPSVVQVQASSVNRLDWYVTTGRPWIARLQLGLRAPKSHLIGADFAGTVETAGKDVTDLTVGDEVYGSRAGAFAEYVVARDGVARKPANLSFEEAAAVPVAGITALQGLRDKRSCSRDRRCSSTAPRAASGRSQCRSRRRSAPTA
jgi:NADPH:quinone reductase-like Zn-dependent oxidoreductase